MHYRFTYAFNRELYSRLIAAEYHPLTAPPPLHPPLSHFQPRMMLPCDKSFGATSLWKRDLRWRPRPFPSVVVLAQLGCMVASTSNARYGFHVNRKQK